MPIDEEKFNAGTEPTGRSGTGVKSRVIAFLVKNHKKGAYSPAEIKESLEVEQPQQIYGAIKALAEKGHIEKRQPADSPTYYVRLTEAGLEEHSK